MTAQIQIGRIYRSDLSKWNQQWKKQLKQCFWWAKHTYNWSNSIWLEAWVNWPLLKRYQQTQVVVECWQQIEIRNTDHFSWLINHLDSSRHKCVFCFCSKNWRWQRRRLISRQRAWTKTKVYLCMIYIWKCCLIQKQITVFSKVSGTNAVERLQKERSNKS